MGARRLGKVFSTAIHLILLRGVQYVVAAVLVKVPWCCSRAKNEPDETLNHISHVLG